MGVASDGHKLTFGKKETNFVSTWIWRTEPSCEAETMLGIVVELIRDKDIQISVQNEKVEKYLQGERVLFTVKGLPIPLSRWAQCHWCPYWVYDPYIIDWIGAPLCNLCYDYHLGLGSFQSLKDEDPEWYGLPYDPSALTRCAAWLSYSFCSSNVAIFTQMAYFFVDELTP